MRLLVVVTRFPFPPRRGDQMRTVATCELLAGEHRVTLLAPEPDPGTEPGNADSADLPYRLETYAVRSTARAWGVARSALSGLPLQSGLFRQPDLARRLRELAPEADLAILQLVRLAAHADDLGQTPFVVDLIDSLALNFERRARFDRPWRRPLLRLEARRLLSWETRLVGRATAALLVCERDRNWLADRLPPASAAKLAVVPLWLPAADRPPVARRTPDVPPRICFTGNLGYFPNADAAVHLARDLWPALRAAHPRLTLTLAGARPPRRVRRLGATPGVELHDTPPDLAPLLAGATAAVAPLRAGSGVPVKVLEAWAAGVPVIASPWAAAGVSGNPGRDLLVAATAEQWRDAVGRLVRDPALSDRLTDAGRTRLRAAHTRGAVARSLGSIVDRASPPAGTRPSSPPAPS